MNGWLWKGSICVLNRIRPFTDLCTEWMWLFPRLSNSYGWSIFFLLQFSFHTDIHGESVYFSFSLSIWLNFLSRSQVFMRAPFVEDLEKQRLKRTNYLLVKLQAVARGRFYRQVLFEIFVRQWEWLRMSKLCGFCFRGRFYRQVLCVCRIPVC